MEYAREGRGRKERCKVFPLLGDGREKRWKLSF